MLPLPCTLYRYKLELGERIGVCALTRYPYSHHAGEWSMEHVAIVRSFIAALPNKNLTTRRRGVTMVKHATVCPHCDSGPLQTYPNARARMV